MKEKKQIKNLGVITGDILVFGGVYSNLQALEALKFWADENGYGANRVFCTGDILGYCAQPVECIDLIRQWGIHVIAGNVEIQTRNREVDCGCDFTSGGRCDLFSRNWYAYIQSQLKEDEIDWLQTLPHHLQFHYNGKEVMVVHGSWFHTSDFIFRSTSWQTKAENFGATGVDIILAGHCGLPFADEQNGKLWLNAGVIGMPANDGTDRVWFATIHPSANGIHYTFHHLQYDYKQAADLMRRHGLPLSYANTLETGLWDNCEILPEEETLLQGKPIEFEQAKNL